MAYGTFILSFTTLIVYILSSACCTDLGGSAPYLLGLSVSLFWVAMDAVVGMAMLRFHVRESPMRARDTVEPSLVWWLFPTVAELGMHGWMMVKWGFFYYELKKAGFTHHCQVGFAITMCCIEGMTCIFELFITMMIVLRVVYVHKEAAYSAGAGLTAAQ